ncbi:unnamed protein product [Amoebophrya sp. A120]|nr:unnamed protein product [Amoebophrya sp. A120]|eukprot:GSA120T00004802001.1
MDGPTKVIFADAGSNTSVAQIPQNASWPSVIKSAALWKRVPVSLIALLPLDPDTGEEVPDGETLGPSPRPVAEAGAEPEGSPEQGDESNPPPTASPAPYADWRAFCEQNCEPTLAHFRCLVRDTSASFVVLDKRLPNGRVDFRERLLEDCSTDLDLQEKNAALAMPALFSTCFFSGRADEFAYFFPHWAKNISLIKQILEKFDSPNEQRREGIAAYELVSALGAALGGGSGVKHDTLLASWTTWPLLFESKNAGPKLPPCSSQILLPIRMEASCQIPEQPEGDQNGASGGTGIPENIVTQGGDTEETKVDIAAISERKLRHALYDRRFNWAVPFPDTVLVVVWSFERFAPTLLSAFLTNYVFTVVSVNLSDMSDPNPRVIHQRMRQNALACRRPPTPPDPVGARFAAAKRAEEDYDGSNAQGIISSSVPNAAALDTESDDLLSDSDHEGLTKSPGDRPRYDETENFRAWIEELVKKGPPDTLNFAETEFWKRVQPGVEHDRMYGRMDYPHAPTVPRATISALFELPSLHQAARALLNRRHETGGGAVRYLGSHVLDVRTLFLPDAFGGWSAFCATLGLSRTCETANLRLQYRQLLGQIENFLGTQGPKQTSQKRHGFWITEVVALADKLHRRALTLLLTHGLRDLTKAEEAFCDLLASVNDENRRAELLQHVEMKSFKWDKIEGAAQDWCRFCNIQQFCNWEKKIGDDIAERRRRARINAFDNCVWQIVTFDLWKEVEPFIYGVKKG